MKQKAFIVIFLFFSLFLPANVFALTMQVPQKVSQGHAFPVTISHDTPFKASITWLNEKFDIQGENSNSPIAWTTEILLPMPINAKGTYRLSVKLGDKTQTHSIQAIPVPWPQSILTVEPKYVQPPQSVLEQIAKDREESKKALATRTDAKLWELPILKPVNNGVTSPFGGRRVFNKQPRAPHTGTDMRAYEGVPISACADGVVLLSKMQYFGGNTVYLDHGQGVISSYSHMSRIDVAQGDYVKKGQVVGLSGSTGRVTAAHLHFGFYVRGIAVDAMPLCSSPIKLVGGPTKTIYQKQASNKKKGRK